MSRNRPPGCHLRGGCRRSCPLGPGRPRELIAAGSVRPLEQPPKRRRWNRARGDAGADERRGARRERRAGERRRDGPRRDAGGAPAPPPHPADRRLVRRGGAQPRVGRGRADRDVDRGLLRQRAVRVDRRPRRGRRPGRGDRGGDAGQPPLPPARPAHRARHARERDPEGLRGPAHRRRLRPARHRRGRERQPRPLHGATIAQAACWVGGTALGAAVHLDASDGDALGIDVIFPAFFLYLLLGESHGAGAYRVAAAGALIALVLIPLTPAGIPVVAATLAAVLGMRRTKAAAA